MNTEQTGESQYYMRPMPLWQARTILWGIMAMVVGAIVLAGSNFNPDAACRIKGVVQTDTGISRVDVCERWIGLNQTLSVWSERTERIHEPVKTPN